MEIFQQINIWQKYSILHDVSGLVSGGAKGALALTNLREPVFFKFGNSEKATKFEKIFHLQFDITD